MVFVAKYLTFLGWGIGAKQVIGGSTCTVQNHASTGLDMFAICSIDGQPKQALKTVKFDWPEPHYPK